LTPNYIFMDDLFAFAYTFLDELFAFDYTFMNEHSNPKRHKQKKTRRKHERYTQFCAFFVYRRRKSVV